QTSLSHSRDPVPSAPSSAPSVTASLPVKWVLVLLPDTRNPFFQFYDRRSDIFSETPYFMGDAA
ncbi:MAG: hypothetical protein KKE27_02205, partial [Alphaproteobacteria bacterium]|nr:hypothetical protein [Alphaproteobacteria bacterium]